MKNLYESMNHPLSHKSFHLQTERLGAYQAQREIMYITL